MTKTDGFLTMLSFLLYPLVFSSVIMSQEKADTTVNYGREPDAYPSAISAKIIGGDKADSSRYFRSALNAYPYAFYRPETQLAFGAGGVFTFFTKKDRELNPSKIVLASFYSTVKTYEINSWINLYFSKNRVASTAEITFSHTVDRYYGIGNNTPDLGTEEYILENIGGIFDFQLPPAIAMSDRSGLIFEYRYYSLVDKKENPYLQNDTLNGVQGGNVSGLGLVWVWDTRDQVFFPNYGGLFNVRALFYVKDVGSDYTFSWLEVDSRRYWSFKSDQVVAVQVYFNSITGNPPFYELPALGGPKRMRGYFLGRYRDCNYLAVQLEYRQYFWKRLGFVAFLGSGDVASEVTKFQLTKMKNSYGVGLRFLFNKQKKINLRMDIGFGENTNGVYFGMEEAF